NRSVGSASPQLCPACGAEALPTDRFCEACGTALQQHASAPADLPPAPTPSSGPPPSDVVACAECQGIEVDADGYCVTCGLRRAAVDPFDHTEIDRGPVGGVSDRGLTHPTNEDAMAADASAAGGGALVAVVCDGVSQAAGSGPGARAAAEAALATLASATLASRAASIADGDTGADGATGADGDTADLGGVGGAAGDAIRAAAAAGQAAIEALPAGPGEDPSCTFAAALFTGGVLTVGWLGDSRVYLLDGDGPRLLTADDTVAAEAARAGLIPAEDAETARGAHTITSWLGRSSPRTTPHIHVAHPTGPGRVLLCTDGLWNHASPAGVLAALVAELPAGASAAEVARHLTAAALRAGGHDNITVVVMDIPGRA
ncbi:protein phosphatase 2C domain-containing protein, partial [Frankia canadensis]|uniref:protein phosphatase 2C domain-containing protein n=1 Tax=Frankia canadensis TaxID=1836972 RepID=UPI000C79A4AC